MRRPLLFIAGVVTLFVIYVTVIWTLTFHPAFDRNRLGSELCGDSPGEVCPTDEGRTMAPAGR